MNKCIYCGKNNPEVTFKSVEHVIPRLLGVFDNNPTLVGCVCDNCNQKIFGPLETRFKEDTHEGVMCQRFNFSSNHQIRIRNKKYKMSAELGLEDAFFNQMFPFFRFNNGKLETALMPQIKISGYAGEGYIILLIDEIKKLQRGRTKFKKLKNTLNGVKSKDVSIFTHGGDGPQNKDFDEAVELVRELGIPFKFKPEERKFEPASDPAQPTKTIVINIGGTIDSDTFRILAKIAFNHFAYCAKESGGESLLHHPNFSKIKSYILGQEIPLDQIMLGTPTSEGIIADEKESSESGNGRFLGHTVIFDIKNGYIISQVSFVAGFVYTVLLGKAPDEFNRTDFGNGHFFNPVNREIVGLTKNEARRGNKEKLSFSVFNG